MFSCFFCCKKGQLAGVGRLSGNLRARHRVKQGTQYAKCAIKNTTFIATSSSEMKGVNILKSPFDLGDAVGFNSQFFYSE